MPSVTIYGASDDLIEVEGAVSEEFSTDGYGNESVLVVGGHGQLVIVTPELGDVAWEVKARIIRPGTRGYEASVQTIPRPDGRGEDGDMAVKVFVSDPVHVFKVVNQ